MTTADITVLSQPDVVTRLHAAFGGLRSWAYFLTDCILDRTSVVSQIVSPRPCHVIL